MSIAESYPSGDRCRASVTDRIRRIWRAWRSSATTTLERNVLMPPLLLNGARVDVRAGILADVHDLRARVEVLPLPAKVMPVNSMRARSPFKMLIGYRQTTCEPNEPEIHSIVPPSSTTRALGIEVVHVLRPVFDGRIAQTRAFCDIQLHAAGMQVRHVVFRGGAAFDEVQLAPSSTMISVCSNWPAPGAFRRKYDCSGIATCTPLGTYTNEPPDQTAPCSAANL